MSASIPILDHGRPLRLDCEGLIEYHGGGALAGAAIGFRAMEYAGVALSTARLWDRKDLAVVSWHGGSGVRDAIEFVTRAITRGRFELLEVEGGQNCASASAFRFEVGDGRRVVQLLLREGLVSARFFALAGIDDRSADEQVELARLKSAVAAAVMTQPLRELFDVSVRELACA